MTSRPIGIFDSGVGGLTVVRAVRRVLPGEDIVYLGDTARVPYGSKSPTTVERYARACQQFLLDRDVKLVMIACNTASATALDALREASPVPVIGAVEPGARSAAEASGNGHIGVIGTLATVRSRAYENAIGAIAPHAVVTAEACPLFVPLAEEGWTDGEVASAVAREYLQRVFGRDGSIDTLVLGCTHYPLLRDLIERVANDLAEGAVTVVDSATAMAAVARDTLADEVVPPSRSKGGKPPGAEAGSLHCYATDASRLDELAPRFLGAPLDHFDLADL